MKKNLFLTFAIAVLFSVTGNAQNDTITGWDFSDTTNTEFNANLGLVSNQGYDIRAEDTSGTSRTLTYTNGITNYAATATGWEDGADAKYWSIKFKANGYTSMTISSKQRSGGTDAGPKYWKIQCQKSGEPWIDVTGGDVTVGNDWTTGVVTDLPLPAALDNPGTTSLYIRWIMTSNEDINAGTVASTGIAKIDDIIVKGVNSAGISTIIYENNVCMYPNPCEDILNIESTELLSRVEIYDMQGGLVYSGRLSGQNAEIDMSKLNTGLYFVQLFLQNESKTVSRRIVVE
jgi:hypothetical protein